MSHFANSESPTVGVQDSACFRARVGNLKVELQRFVGNLKVELQRFVGSLKVEFRLLLLLSAILLLLPEMASYAAKPATHSFEVRRFLDLAYRCEDPSTPELPQADRLADLYVPVTEADKVGSVRRRTDGGATASPIRIDGPLRPAILLIHGGAWMTGDKWLLGTYADDLSKSGFVVLNINYRLAPQSKFPAQVDDVREGLIYLREHADELAIDVKRIGMFGYSAGGHLSALVGVLADEPSSERESASDWSNEDPRWAHLPKVAAVCAGGPPCDFRELPLDNTAMTYFLRGTRRELPELYEAASPTAHVSAADPPMQLFHGENDFLVPLQATKEFASALQNADVSVDLTIIAGHGHLMTFMHPTSRAVVRNFFVEQLTPVQ